MGLNFRCAFWFQAGVLRSIRQPIQVLDRIVARRSSAKSFKSLAERLQSSAKMLSGNPRIDCWYCTIEMSRPNSMPSRRPSSRPSRSPSSLPSRSPSSLPSRRPSSRPSILAPLIIHRRSRAAFSCALDTLLIHLFTSTCLRVLLSNQALDLTFCLNNWANSESSSNESRINSAVLVSGNPSSDWQFRTIPTS